MARLTIELAGLELFGYHGVLAEEREQGQRFLVDLWLELADTTAGDTDLIGDAVDYRAVVAVVREVSDGRAFQLLEAFAADLARTLLARFPLARARVRVRKLDVKLDLPVDHAAVEVEVSRD
jgi:7,8-dihydroneopterin aldolase/epimerase/oxygenase